MRNLISIIRNQQGQSFIENALYVIIVVLLLAVAAYNLANSGVKPKYTELQGTISNVTVPDIN
jgi:hypothetical protein